MPPVDYEFGPFALHAEQKLLTRDGAAIPLGPKVVETLLVLIEAAGQPVSKDRLIERVWPEGFVDESSLSQNIYLLRKALREGLDADPIETLPRRGYRFTAALRSTVHEPQVAGPKAFPVRRVAIALAVLVFIALAATLFAANRRYAQAALDPGTQRIYELARFYWEKRTATDEARAIGLFKQVVDRAPLSPYGYLGLADAYGVDANYCFAEVDCAENMRLANGMLAKALALAPDLAQAHATAAVLATIGQPGDYAKAEEESRRAIALDPGYALAHHWYGVALFNERRFDDARREFETAARLDPTSSVIAAWLARDYYFLHRYEDCISFDKQSLQLSPRLDSTATMGLSYAKLHRYREALDELAHLDALGTPEKAQVLRAYVLALSGDRSRALTGIARLHAATRPKRFAGGYEPQHFRTVGNDDLAAVYLAAGDRARSDALVRALAPEQRAWAAVDPRFSTL